MRGVYVRRVTVLSRTYMSSIRGHMWPPSHSMTYSDIRRALAAGDVAVLAQLFRAGAVKSQTEVQT